MFWVVIWWMLVVAAIRLYGRLSEIIIAGVTFSDSNAVQEKGFHFGLRNFFPDFSRKSQPLTFQIHSSTFQVLLFSNLQICPLWTFSFSIFPPTFPDHSSVSDFSGTWPKIFPWIEKALTSDWKGSHFQNWRSENLNFDDAPVKKFCVEWQEMVIASQSVPRAQFPPFVQEHALF